jgi:hypothetical protein
MVSGNCETLTLKAPSPCCQLKLSSCRKVWSIQADDPAFSCQATINLSFRDKSHSPIEAPHNYLNAYAGTTGGLRPGGTPEYRRAINPEDIVLQGR